MKRIESLYTRIGKQWEEVDKSSLIETIIHDDWHPKKSALSRRWISCLYPGF